MTESNQHGQKAEHPTNIFAILSLDAGIFGWLAGVFAVLTGFPITPIASYFHFGRLAGWILLALLGISWLTAILAGLVGARQTKGAGPAKWGIAISGVGCALFYGFIVLVAIGLYLVLRRF